MAALWIVFAVGFLILVADIFFLRRTVVAFIDDVNAGLKTQSDAIDALAARLPPPPDPATIVPVTDQQAAVSGITANTAKIDALGK